MDFISYDCCPHSASDAHSRRGSIHRVGLTVTAYMHCTPSLAVLDGLLAVGNIQYCLVWISYLYISLNARRTCALGPAVLNKHWAPMAADHSARGSMKTGVKPETVCELQDTNDHRQVERKWRLPISVGKLSALEGRLINLHHLCAAMDVRHAVIAQKHTWCFEIWQLYGVVSSANSGVVSCIYIHTLASMP